MHFNELNMKAKYNHSVTLHNLKAPKEIVPLMMDIIQPKSVVDVGCGLGTFLRVFQEAGVQDIVGVDGPWCNKELLAQNISLDYFIETELEQPISLNRKFDLVVCLEVAEHLTPGRAKTFVQDLTSMGDVVLFSAAIYKQGGVNHFNEQWLGYWEELFKQQGFELHDVLRPYFWENKKVFSYYRQNMVLFTKAGYKLKEDARLKQNLLKNVVHPDLYTMQMDYKRKESIRHFGKLLARAIRYRILGK